MSCGFNGETEQNQGKTREAMIGLRGFLGCQAQQHREVGDGALIEFTFVEIEEMREVAGWGRVLQAKFGDRLGEGAREAGCLSDGGEIRQVIRGCGGMNDAGGEGFNAQARDGSECETAHGLRGELGGELRESERMNALTP